ncbi:hypothetical protein KJ877_10770 [bacterium]|nr:hypothetical protein [bacterium]MBU1990975.1 hypothetical protein [bacterium]
MVKVKNYLEAIKTFNLSNTIDIVIAMLWLQWYKIKNQILQLNQKYFTSFLTTFMIVLFISTILIIPYIEDPINKYFSNSQHFSELKSLFLGIGGALISASAIAFSIVMFAMQVNVEKLPYGLFKKFSSDIKLLSAFFTTVILSITIALFSLLPSCCWSTYVIALASWSLFLILFLFLFAYRRALKLISPTYQLVLVIKDIKKYLTSWDKAAKRASPLIKIDSGIMSKHDLPKITYFNSYPNWTQPVKQRITYCNTYARRYAEQGDYEVVNISLDALVIINAKYIKIKEKTFFATNPFFNTANTTDSVINETLEHLRQNIRFCISRNDELFLELNFKTMYKLIEVYFQIDYSNDSSEKHHANLATNYLLNAVEDCLPHNLTDVLMEGNRLLGNAALLELEYGSGLYMSNISKKISFISSVCMTQKMSPVSVTGVEQLARISLALIALEANDVKHNAKEIRENISMIAKVYLASNINNMFDTPLSTYYGHNSEHCLLSNLTNLANKIIQSPADNPEIQTIIHKLSEWSDQMYIEEKELLLETIKYKSHFVSDMINSITHTTKILFAVSFSQWCLPNEKEKLERNAEWLISVLDFIPSDEESILFVENYSLSENLLDAAIDANYKGLDSISMDIQKILLSFAFKFAKYDNQWRNFEKIISSCIVLHMHLGIDDSIFITNIKKELLKDFRLTDESRKYISTELCKVDDKIRSYSHSHVISIMKTLDRIKLKENFETVSRLIAPS